MEAGPGVREDWFERPARNVVNYALLHCTVVMPKSEPSQRNPLIGQVVAGRIRSMVARSRFGNCTLGPWVWRRHVGGFSHRGDWITPDYGFHGSPAQEGEFEEKIDSTWSWTSVVHFVHVSTTIETKRSMESFCWK